MKKNHSLEILHEDQWVIVVSKPSGMLSVGFPGNRAKTAQDILTEMNRGRGRHHIAVIHRLDRDTSGVMIFACTAEAKETFMGDWQAIVTERTYRCVCARARGASALPPEGVCDAPIAYNRHDVGFVPRAGDAKALKEAEKAITRFRVLERGIKCDLVECELETGRKNQIRVHMAHLGHPIAGDEVYGVASETGSGEPLMGGPEGRLGLHARVLAFTHPFTGETHRFEVAEPASFARLVTAGAKKSDQAAKPSPKAAGGSAGTKTARVAPGRTGTPEETGGQKLPRRQRGNKHLARKVTRPGNGAYAESAGPDDRSGRREREIEDIGGLTTARRKSRTRQETGKSRFIPGK